MLVPTACAYTSSHSERCDGSTLAVAGKVLGCKRVLEGTDDRQGDKNICGAGLVLGSAHVA